MLAIERLGAEAKLQLLHFCHRFCEVVPQEEVPEAVNANAQLTGDRPRTEERLMTERAACIHGFRASFRRILLDQLRFFIGEETERLPLLFVFVSSEREANRFSLDDVI